MYIERASASSVGTYQFCPFRFYQEYVLGMESPSGKAAVQGTIVHQVFEWICRAVMKGKRELPTERLLEWAWDLHVAQNPRVELRKLTSRGECADYRKCRESIAKVLAHPIYNPWRLKVIQSEQKFSIEMPGEDWQVPGPDGKPQQFRVRGLFDLVHELDPRTIEIVDWKTGKRADWKTMGSLDFFALMRAVQPRFYHFAATQVFPYYQNILVTFYYINDGGPITLPFTFEDSIPTVASIYRFFDNVRRDGTMNRSRTWKCKTFCSFGRNQVCDSVWADLHALGQSHVEERYMGMSHRDQCRITGKV